ncbi:MAG: hypothetical protein HC825_06255, partial [Oscillatoriales cyanobacterium RM1_1_9]|nr:hypothetical protein [Oscillatoriales cyanobacterium RM1_1_9]
MNERRRFRDKNPRIISLKQKQASLNALLQQQIDQVLGPGREFPMAYCRFESKKTIRLNNLS